MIDEIEVKIEQLYRKANKIPDKSRCKKALLISNGDVDKAYKWLMKNSDKASGNSFFNSNKRAPHGICK